VKRGSRGRGTLAGILLLPALLAGPLQAQQQETKPSPPLVKYGKWALVAASGVLNIMAAREHNDAEAAFDQIREQCTVDTGLCTIGPDGGYANPSLEALYQTSLGHDRSARRYLFAGETLLAGAAVMFIWELTRPRASPGNIPFEPTVEHRPGVTTFGVQFRF
jgi:hypothetical protein